MAHAPLQAPMSQVLSACAVELADLAYRCDVLQGALAAGIAQVAIRDAQAFDLVTQSLAALSQYLGSIAEDVPDGWRLDPTAAAAALPLASLADRLIAGEAITDASGDLCLFESVP